MATIQARMLSGRYRTERLARYWSSNVQGFCLLPSCRHSKVHETLQHILVGCPALTPTRSNLESFTAYYKKQLPNHTAGLLDVYCRVNHPLFPQFLVDCSPLPEVIEVVQVYGAEALHHLFRVTRTWCYSLHRERLKLLGIWQLLK